MAQRSYREEQAMEATEMTARDPAIVAAAASVVLSWYSFFVQGNRELGLFIGLWPPTILAFASYFKQTRMADRVERAMGESSTIRDSVERMMRGR